MEGWDIFLLAVLELRTCTAGQKTASSFVTAALPRHWLHRDPWYKFDEGFGRFVVLRVQKWCRNIRCPKDSGVSHLASSNKLALSGYPLERPFQELKKKKKHAFILTRHETWFSDVKECVIFSEACCG